MFRYARNVFAKFTPSQRPWPDSNRPGAWRRGMLARSHRRFEGRHPEP